MRRHPLIRVVAAVVLTACGGATGPSDGQPVGVTQSTTVNRTIPSAFAAFDTATVVVTSGEGERLLPVWLAADDAQRRRGLMEVGDPALEGRDGMAFWFPGVVEGGFWMRNTRLPLTIVFVGEDGGVVAIAEMFPCPDSETNCPVTRPGTGYRWALEVPTSRWAEVGIDDTSTLTLVFDDVSATGSS